MRNTKKLIVFTNAVVGVLTNNMQGHHKCHDRAFVGLATPVWILDEANSVSIYQTRLHPNDKTVLTNSNTPSVNHISLLLQDSNVNNLVFG